MKILITGGKSAKALKMLNHYQGHKILLADYGEMPAFPSVRCSFLSLGERNDDIIAHHLLTFCLDHGVEAILPVYDFEVKEIGKSAILFEEFNIQVLDGI